MNLSDGEETVAQALVETILNHPIWRRRTKVYDRAARRSHGNSSNRHDIGRFQIERFMRGDGLEPFPEVSCRHNFDRRRTAIGHTPQVRGGSMRCRTQIATRENCCNHTRMPVCGRACKDVNASVQPPISTIRGTILDRPRRNTTSPSLSHREHTVLFFSQRYEEGIGHSQPSHIRHPIGTPLIPLRLFWRHKAQDAALNDAKSPYRTRRAAAALCFSIRTGNSTPTNSPSCTTARP